MLLARIKKQVFKLLTLKTAEELPAWFGLALFQVANWVSIIGMALFVLVGFWEIGRGVYAYFMCDGKSSTLLKTALGGIEFFLLAPLGFLMLRALARYMESIALERKVMSDVRQDLIEVKALITSLLVAAIATHYVGRVVSGGHNIESNSSGTVDRAIGGDIFGLILMGLLMGYYFGLEFLERRLPPLENSEHTKGTS